MIEIKGKISISRVHPQKEEDFIMIEITEAKTGIIITIGEMSLSDFAKAITGHGNMNIKLKIFDSYKNIEEE